MLKLFKRQSPETWLLVGLGNPTDRHKGNRHNVGFMVIDEVAKSLGAASFRSKFQGLISEGTVGSHKIILLKPLTYMNNSGQSVKAASKFFKIAPDHIIVFHDELDLEPNKLRIKVGGGNAGHNGLKSLQSHLGTADFLRVRIGIGHPGDKSKVHNYVLKDFSKADHKWVSNILSGIATHLDLLVEGDKDNFMSKVSQSLDL